MQNDLRHAIIYAKQSVEIMREIGMRRGLLVGLGNLADYYLNLGEYNLVIPYLREAIQLAQQLDSPAWLLGHILTIAKLRLAENNFTSALALLGLARQHPASDSDIIEQVDGLLDKVQTTLPEAEIEAGLEAGKTLDLAVVIAEFLRETDPK
jgi:hypothetical protein